mgnify:CR=1 FL=1
MIAMFSPIRNSLWFELREIEFRDWFAIARTVPVEKYRWVLHELPVFKPKTEYNDDKEWNKMKLKNNLSNNTTIYERTRTT